MKERFSTLKTFLILLLSIYLVGLGGAFYLTQNYKPKIKEPTPYEAPEVNEYIDESEEYEEEDEYSESILPSIKSLKVTDLDPDITKEELRILKNKYTLNTSVAREDETSLYEPVFLDKKGENSFSQLPANYPKGIFVIMGFEAYGSGFAFYKDAQKTLVMTNAHVVDQDSEELFALSYSGKLLKVNKYVTDFGRDLAILELDSANIEPLKISATNSKRNEKVILVGSPKQRVNTVTTGEIGIKEINRVIYDEENDVEYFIENVTATAQVDHGGSGGPVFNTKGEVIGVVCCVFNTAFSNKSGFIDYDNMTYRIKDYLDDGKLTKYSLGIDIKVVKDTKRGYLITKVTEGKIAEKYGLEVGDIIQKVNGYQVGLNKASALYVMKALQDGLGGDELMELTVYKKSSNKTIDVDIKEK